LPAATQRISVCLPQRRTRGIAPLGEGIIEELIARMSPRRIVDDPGSASFPDPSTLRKHWQNRGGLSGKTLGELL
jgi:hypothetical protein